MSGVIDPWLDIVRREAQHVAFYGQSKSTLIATSYDPNNHAVKGILQPHGVETGWVRLAAIHIGNGYGILVGPNVGNGGPTSQGSGSSSSGSGSGSGQQITGDQFDIHFEFGDPNRPMAVHRRFSTVDQPPVVQSGEMLLMKQPSDGSTGSTDPSAAKQNKLFFDQKGNVSLAHESGNSFVFGADKTITTTHFAKNGTMKWDASGNVEVQTNGGNVTTDAGSGTNRWGTDCTSAARVFDPCSVHVRFLRSFWHAAPAGPGRQKPLRNQGL
jgi:hypothetical protein